MSNNTIQGLDDKTSSDSKSDTASSAKGPPAAFPRPRQAADSSVFAASGKAAAEGTQSGLGAEGASTAMLGMQGLAMVQRGLQMLNLSFPDNPGLVAVLADITGRLQSIVPQLIAQQSNGGAMGMGLFPQPQAAPPIPGGAPQGAPPMGAPPMGAGGPPQGGPPPMPPMGQ